MVFRVQVLDFGDTLVKGWSYFVGLGLEYPIRNLVIIALSGIAIRTRNERFHSFMVILLTGYQLLWIMRLFNRVG